MTDRLTPKTCRDALEKRIKDLSRHPGTYDGRGVVVCAGGSRYFPCAWVCVNMLRRHGCTLPVQFWHLGPEECTVQMRQLTAPLGVEWVDGLEVSRRFPVRRLGGWELKPYAILHSPFREVMLLDADNVPVRNPEYLFDSAEFERTGAIFWPDFGRLPRRNRVWGYAGIPFRDEPEFESGQIFVDKARRWRELELTVWFNDHGRDFWYHHILGDKETFHLAWRKLGTPYSMPSRPIYHLGGHTMCQHDFQGERVFQHRNLDKWRLDGNNRVNCDFLFQNECTTLLAELRRLMPHLRATQPAKREHRVAAPTRRRRLPSRAKRSLPGLWHYERVGHDARFLELRPDGSVGLGSARCETQWSADGSGAVLTLSGSTPTCRLKRDANDGCWRGRWLRYERMPVVMTPISVHTAADKLEFVETWEKDLYDFAALRRAPVSVLDVGAGAGAFACRAANAWPEARILAWEPRPVAGPLRHNLERYPNARLLADAIEDRELEDLIACLHDIVRVDLDAPLPEWIGRLVERVRLVMYRSASEARARSEAARMTPRHKVRFQRQGASTVVAVERGSS